MGLTRAAITRPIFIFMLMVAAFLMGTISYRSMRVELNPEVNFGVVTIQTTYPGANPDTINTQVSRKIEEAVSGVNGLREVTSTSQSGQSSVVVQLELGVDVDAAINDVRSKVDAITNDLPKDALKPQVSKVDTSASPVLYLAFSSKKVSSRDLRNLIDDKLRDRFAQIPGVASVGVQGGDVREIEVQVRKDKLLSYQIGITDVQKAIANANQDVPGGRLVTRDQEYTLRVYNQYENADQLKSLIFTVNNPNDQGAKAQSIHLTDVADIVDSIQERTAYSRLNGTDTIVLAIQKAREGNAVEITKQAEAAIAQIGVEYKDLAIDIQKTQEQAKQITDSISDVQFAVYFGVFLVAIIVYIFLHNLRGTMIVALAIPTSIFCTFIAIRLFGFTINNMSMLALSLAIGVLVDDAIVVIENIYRHLKMGEDPREAALNGRSEIGLAAIAITFADVVVFLPIAFMGGIVGQFFKPLAVGYVCATLFSLFVSFTLTPMLASRWYRRGEDMEHPTGWFARSFERGFGRLENFYRRVLEWALTHRWFVFLSGNVILFAVFSFLGGSFASKASDAFQSGIVPFAAASIFIGIITTFVNLFRFRRFSFKYIAAGVAFGLVFPVASVVGFGYAQWKQEQVFKFGFLPDSDAGQVTANIELPPGTNLAQTQKIVEKIEKIFATDSDVKYVLSNVGTQGVGSFSSSNSGPNYAQVLATLYDKESFTDRFKKHTEKLRQRSADSVAADLLQKVGRVPGARVTVSAASSFGFGSAIQLSFTSDDRAALVETTSKVQRGLANGAIKGVINPDVSSKPGKPEIRVTPDPALIADANISVSDVGTAARMLYQGNDDSKIRPGGQEFGINVIMSPEDRNNPDLVDTVPLKFIQGKPVYLGSIGKLSTAPGIDRIVRRNRAEEIQVTADLLPGFAPGSVQLQLDSWLKASKLVPANVHYRALGQADAQARESTFLFSSLFIGIVLVYMLLASLYDNLLYPLIIQIAQPQAMVGALLALVLTNKSLNLVGFIGIIALVGLVGKNAILLVDYANTLRARGRTRHDALVEAGPTRLRPILMTTSALILGMMPVALAIGRGSEFRETIGITVIGGITLSTMLTLVVIPCSYTIFDDATLGLGRLMSRITGRRQTIQDPDAPTYTEI